MSKAVKNPLFWALLVFLSVVFIAPVLFILFTSFKTKEEASRMPPTVLPEQWTTDAYEQLLNDPASPIGQWFLNSFLVATIFSVFSVTVCALAGYALARMKFRGRDTVFGIVLGMMFIPGFVFFMPNYEVMSKLEWLDTYQALIVPGAASAFGLFFMRQFFKGLPVELEESARIDGAGPFTIFLRIILPNARAALVTLLVLQFLANWNDFLWPLYVIYSDHMRTLPIGLSQLQGAYIADYPVAMAGASLAAIPVLILFVFVQRYVIQGVAASGLKG